LPKTEPIHNVRVGAGSPELPENEEPAMVALMVVLAEAQWSSAKRLFLILGWRL
jgi:hypothetical protein